MGKKYKPRRKPTLEYLTMEGVIRWAQTLNVPYQKYKYYDWKNFGEFADILEAAKQKRERDAENRERLVRDWLLVKDK